METKPHKTISPKAKVRLCFTSLLAVPAVWFLWPHIKNWNEEREIDQAYNLIEKLPLTSDNQKVLPIWPSPDAPKSEPFFEYRYTTSESLSVAGDQSTETFCDGIVNLSSLDKASSRWNRKHPKNPFHYDRLYGPPENNALPQFRGQFVSP